MESITKPVIGIVFCGFSDDRLFVPFSYIQAIEKSDGIPVIIPYLSDADSLSSYLSICDGFLFCGGDDITPELFGEELQTDHGTTDRKTDQFHLTLMQKVLDFHLLNVNIKCDIFLFFNKCLSYFFNFFFKHLFR